MELREDAQAAAVDFPGALGYYLGRNSEILPLWGSAMSTITVQIRRKGVITLPVELRRQYSLDEGDVLTLLDLGDGSFLLTPRISQVARQGDRVSQIMAEEQVKLEDMLKALDEERERYYQEHYVERQPVSGQ